jgi:pentalenene oxygenase
MHRDPELWDAPERFDPDRWLDGSAAGLPRGAFFPFSDGPRKCIGEHFARAEALLALATLACRWELRKDTDAPVRLDAKVTLRPDGPVVMRPYSRS